MLQTELATGDSGAPVILLQIYLIYSSDGVAHDRLAAAGPTGYYGSITAAALAELQETVNLDPTGVYTSSTQRELAGRTLSGLVF